ncbi:1-acyl-sn-glycerol-3-phosphate acyltransferase [Endozoicomonas ascidiicola]|uniref:1-acyl-sn-glycerol-3-phosphate acyltransferase n=1 Tax=Endozoicomonas ascidiicola TaxID=1698521 RepID=UPI0008307499|nr:1-acyl-sn-glycerol-3-phosphate acyltransferase [Endozoicomonas ascidiicola]
MEAFDDIRPYFDNEVRQTLNRLLQDPDLLDVLAKHRYPKLARLLPAITQQLTSVVLKYKTRHIDNVHSFQGLIEPFLTRVIKTTTSRVTFSGLEQLDKDKAHLFLSNHRDIVLDPALVNYALYQNGMETCQIAIGDNLINRPFVSDLMRLNKSFIVKRSVTGRREKFLAFQNLSAYIHHCIDTGQPVWIAQSEGRAKDGNDRTDPAIIKMFNLSKKNKSTSFADNIRSFNLVPVSISYEYDPCDINKARELYEKTESGHYQKEDDEDLRSIVTGIEGFKGHVHVAFGQPLTDSFNDAGDVAREVDRQIHHNYQLQPSNLLALETLEGDSFSTENAIESLFPNINTKKKRSEFANRLESCPEAHRQGFLKMYAQPAINRFGYDAESVNHEET